MNAGRDPRNISFYCDSQKREIGLLIQDGKVMHPVEIKARANVRAEAVRNFEVLSSFTDYEVGFGNVICQTETPYMISRDVQAIPVWAI